MESGKEGKEEYLQLCLVHVEWFFEITAQRGDQDLVYFKLHNEIGKPPALGALYTVFGAVTFCNAFLHDAGGRDGRGGLCLLGGQGSLYGGRKRSGGGEGEAFSPKDTDGQETCARGGLAIWVCWGGGCGAGWLVRASGERSRRGFLCELAKSFEHEECEQWRMNEWIYLANYAQRVVTRRSRGNDYLPTGGHWTRSRRPSQLCHPVSSPPPPPPGLLR